MRYLFIIIVFASCNSETATPIKINVADSTIKIPDSILQRLESLDSFAAQSIVDVQNKIAQLTHEKKEVERQIEREPVYLKAVEDDRDKIIDDLRKKVFKYENEIARLKKRLSEDSAYMARVDRVPNKTEPVIEKPNEESLIVELDTKIKKEKAPVNGLDVYIVPFDRKAKSLMQYEIYCDLKKINSLGGKQARFYNGNYFFNDLSPGKYLIKICYYYGGYKIVEKKEGQQIVSMQVSPPIQ